MRPYRVLVAATATALGHCLFALGEIVPGAPACIHALINRQEPLPPNEWFTPQELTVMAERLQFLDGPDGHGYNFPGPIDAIHAINPDAVALSHWEAMGVQPDGQRLFELEFTENVFIHSTDPSSLTASINGASTTLWFLQDVRSRQISPQHEPVGVTEYLVEWATNDNGPWNLLETVQDQGVFFYDVEDNTVEPARLYRVRSRLTTGQVVNYSWTASVDPGASAAVAIAAIDFAGDMFVLCYGSCPADPTDVRMEVDIDNDKVFEVDEQYPMSTVADFGDGGFLYEGNTDDKDIARLHSFRAVLYKLVPVAYGPSLGRYQMSRNNNRVQLRLFGSYLLWANHPVYVAQTQQRLDDAMALGYAGMRFDFAFDTLELTWAATGVPPDWVVGSGDTRIADQVELFLTAIRAHRPDALLTINGRWAVNDATNFFDRFMPHVDGGDIEFFVIGNDPQAYDIQDNTGESLDAVFQLRAMGKLAMCLAGANEGNHVGRLKAFAFYLLVVDDGVFFYNELGADNNQSVVHLPEWEVPLGAPITPVDDLFDLVDPVNPNLLSRQFEHGRVVFNNSVTIQTITLEQPMSLLLVEGGVSPLVGGNGVAAYNAVTQIDLPPGEVAILVTTSTIPTLSEWGVGLMFLLIATAGTVCIRRRPSA